MPARDRSTSALVPVLPRTSSVPGTSTRVSPAGPCVAGGSAPGSSLASLDSVSSTLGSSLASLDNSDPTLSLTLPYRNDRGYTLGGAAGLSVAP
ncbi:hypothetical protein MY3296_010136 [Beauveria thailandica]